MIAILLALAMGGLVIGFMVAVVWEDVKDNDWD